VSGARRPGKEEYRVQERKQSKTTSKGEGFQPRRTQSAKAAFIMSSSTDFLPPRSNDISSCSVLMTGLHSTIASVLMIDTLSSSFVNFARAHAHSSVRRDPYFCCWSEVGDEGALSSKETAVEGSYIDNSGRTRLSGPEVGDDKLSELSLLSLRLRATLCMFVAL